MGNDTSSGPFVGGTQNFYDKSVFDASVANAASGNSYQNFHDESVLNASTANALTTGFRVFNDKSVLNISAADALGSAGAGAQYRFYDSSVLNALVADGLGGQFQEFNNSSVLNALVTSAVSRGLQYFRDASVLNALDAGAVNGGIQRFTGATSALNASVANAIKGGAQEFYSTSALNASAENAVSGGEQTFYDKSTLNATAANAISGGMQLFRSMSTLNASAENAVSGGEQTFYDKSTLNATAANAISGGEQYFFGASVLNATAANAVSGGRQDFSDDSVLNASAANAVSGGNQYFVNNSVLNATIAKAISGGTQDFSDDSVLNLLAANAISGGVQRFITRSVLNATVANAIGGGFQDFYGESVLNAAGSNAISGGSGQRFDDKSTLNALVANAISGGYQAFQGESVLNASAANAISGGVQTFYAQSVLNASAGNAISGGGQSFTKMSVLNALVTNAVSSGFQSFDDMSVLNASAAGAVNGGTLSFTRAGVLNVLVDDALTKNTNTFFEKMHGGPGGTVKLNGHSTVIGGINSISAGSGIIENGGAADGVLTVDTSGLGNSSFSGLLRDGGAGKFALVKTGAGTLQLSGISSYTGSTAVTGGTLQAGSTTAFNTISDFTVASGMLDANGFDQTVASLSNAGTTATNFKGGAVGTTLTVTGDYTGNGGTVLLNTELNDDTSRTDRLRIRGNTAGVSKLAINNVGGPGAQTVEGIRVIEVDGNSAGEFVLSGDYIIAGQQAVVGGAYAYTLHKNGVSTPHDGAWYLRSRLKNLPPEQPLYQAGVPVYEAYPQALLTLNSVSTMQQRIGNRLWRTGAEPDADISSRTDPNTGSWARIEGSVERFDPTRSDSMSSYDVDRYKMQVGLDGLLHETSAGRLFGGLNLHYGNGRTKVSSIYGNGRINTDGYGVGGTLTWYGDNGFYIDNQAQLTFYDSKLASTTAGRTLVNGNNGKGYALSSEVGRRYTVAPGWSVTPQAQLMYSKVSFDSFTDVFGAAVALDRGKSLRARLGLSLDYEHAWRDATGQKKRLQTYGIVNLYNEFLNGTRVDVAGTSFASANERLWGGVGVGGSYSWADGKYKVYGEGSVNTSLNRFGDSYALAGIVGIKIAF
ncbi:autotransporter outer membrane beta-barrel domain-containing protein [Herminiimonas glaciei]|uniref:Autotransporter outer membrane beta-barrel domain-containing protein n=1 Tax=Herminiimonas glaciei TaxID=523788 RepID=A0ABW2IBI8_9BURK